MKKTIKKWLGLNGLEIEHNILRTRIMSLESSLSELEKELGRTQKFIGAIFDYLGVRPQRTFVEDFSRLPDEAMPTMEVIKVYKIKKKTPSKEDK